MSIKCQFSFRLKSLQKNRINTTLYTFRSDKNKHFILMYDGLSLYKFDATDHKYSRKTYSVNFTGQKDANSDYRICYKRQNANHTKNIFLHILHPSTDVQNPPKNYIL